MAWKKRRKIKLWEKLFLLIVITTMILFNLGMYCVVNLSYDLQMKHEKDRAATEEAFVAANLYKDMKELSSYGQLNYEYLSQNFSVYQKYYEDQSITLELWHDDNIYGEDIYHLDNREELILREGYQNLLVRKMNGQPYLFAASELHSPYEEYQIVLSYSLHSVVDLREGLLQITFWIESVMMLAEMVILYLIVRNLMKPMEVLSDATGQIAAGDYQKKIELKGEDEFVQLADRFNAMSDHISEKIHQLEFENESKKRLIDNMAHELRTPLTAIQGYAEYIKLAKVSEEEKIEVLEYVIGQAKRLEKLSNTLLELARIREGESNCHYSLVEVSDLVNTIAHLFKERAEAAHVVLDYQIEQTELLCNKELILILLENLIENAIRACEEQGQVTVSFLEHDGHTRIEVSDNGIGMEESELEKIRQPFYRVDKARSRKNGGVGLGVTLCQQIAQYHSAQLIYESAIGKGTTVSVQFEK